MRWLFVLILVGPYVALQAPLEVGRWKLAAAIQARADGQKDRAYSALADAMNWMPNQPMLYLQRAEWRLADGKQAEAFADADKLVELWGETARALTIHSRFLQNAGRHADAVIDCKKIDEISERSGSPSRVTALNWLAYTRALAKMELAEALQNVNDSLGLAGANAGILDTRAFVLYQMQRHDAALVDMTNAIAIMNAEAREELKKRGPPPAIPPQHRKLLNSLPQAMLEGDPVPVLYYHRALILRALGKEPEAAADIARARAIIGREPDETLF